MKTEAQKCPLEVLIQYGTNLEAFEYSYIYFGDHKSGFK